MPQRPLPRLRDIPPPPTPPESEAASDAARAAAFRALLQAEADAHEPQSEAARRADQMVAASRRYIRRLITGAPFVQGVWPGVVLSIDDTARRWCTVRLVESGDIRSQVQYDPIRPQVGGQYAVRRTVRLNMAAERGAPELVHYTLKTETTRWLYWQNGGNVLRTAWPPTPLEAGGAIWGDVETPTTGVPAPGVLIGAILGEDGQGIAYPVIDTTGSNPLALPTVVLAAHVYRLGKSTAEQMGLGAVYDGLPVQLGAVWWGSADLDEGVVSSFGLNTSYTFRGVIWNGSERVEGDETVSAAYGAALGYSATGGGGATYQAVTQATGFAVIWVDHPAPLGSLSEMTYASSYSPVLVCTGQAFPEVGGAWVVLESLGRTTEDIHITAGEDINAPGQAKSAGESGLPAQYRLVTATGGGILGLDPGPSITLGDVHHDKADARSAIAQPDADHYRIFLPGAPTTSVDGDGFTVIDTPGALMVGDVGLGGGGTWRAAGGVASAFSAYVAVFAILTVSHDGQDVLGAREDGSFVYSEDGARTWRDVSFLNGTDFRLVDVTEPAAPE